MYGSLGQQQKNERIQKIKKLIGIYRKQKNYVKIDRLKYLLKIAKQ